MRTCVSCFSIIVAALILTGCPSQQHALTETTWIVDVLDKDGQQAPFDSGEALDDLSGDWVFNSDGTIQIHGNNYRYLSGTYTLDGANIEFTAEFKYWEYNPSQHSDWDYSISGDLVFDGETLSGSGVYSVFYSNSLDPEYDYSLSGDCNIEGAPLKETFWDVSHPFLSVLSRILAWAFFLFSFVVA